MVENVRPTGFGRKHFGRSVLLVAVLAASAAIALSVVSRTADPGAAARETGAGQPATSAERSPRPRPYLGVTYLPLTPHIARQHHLDIDWGVLVTAVAEDGPARRAGIEHGDILHCFDGQPLTATVSLLGLLWEQKAGNRVPVLGWRDGRHFDAIVVLEER